MAQLAGKPMAAWADMQIANPLVSELVTVFIVMNKSTEKQIAVFGLSKIFPFPSPPQSIYHKAHTLGEDLPHYNVGPQLYADKCSPTSCGWGWGQGSDV